MKPVILCILPILCALGRATAADDAPGVPPAPAAVAAPAAASGEPARSGTDVPDKEIRLNFRGAPLELVLEYFGDAAGYIIDLQTAVHGKVDLWSSRPVTREEAADLLNSVLNRNGYAAVRNGRTLTIVSREEAIRGDVPVRTGNDPETIPRNDEIVTQIVPIRFVEAPQLAKDLAPMVSPKATIVANEAGNSIAITDTQANIRHLVEIIKAMDSSAEDVTVLRVFHLKFADATDMANLLNGLFSAQGSSTAQAPVQFGGRPFGFGGQRQAMFAAMAAPAGATPATAADAQSQRIKRRMQVSAVADMRTASVAVTATKDLMEQIASMIQDLDYHSPKEASVAVFHLNNADPQEVLPVLQDMFQNTSVGGSTRGSAAQNSPLMNRLQQNQNTLGSSSTGMGTGLNGSGSRPGSGVSF